MCVLTTQFSHYRANSAQNEWVWLCLNKTLHIEAGGWLDLACRLWCPYHCGLKGLYNHFFNLFLSYDIFFLVDLKQNEQQIQKHPNMNSHTVFGKLKARKNALGKNQDRFAIWRGSKPPSFPPAVVGVPAQHTWAGEWARPRGGSWEDWANLPQAWFSCFKSKNNNWTSQVVPWQLRGDPFPRTQEMIAFTYRIILPVPPQSEGRSQGCCRGKETPCGAQVLQSCRKDFTGVAHSSRRDLSE